MGNGGKKILKKQLVMLGIVVLLICVGLSGCTEQDKTQDIRSKFIGKWFEEGKENQYMHFFANGIVKDNEQSGTWEIIEHRLIMNIPISEDNQILYPIKFFYEFSNNDTRLTLNQVKKPLVEIHYTKESVWVGPEPD